MKTILTVCIAVLGLLTQMSKAQWVELNPGVNVPYFSDVYAITPNIVVVVGANGNILKTIDGGENWVQKPSGTVVNLEKVQFATSNIGYVAGSEGKLLKTTDGGETWSAINTGHNANFEGLSLVNENLIYIIYSNNLLKSEDGGNSWNNYTLDFFTYGEIQFLNYQKGYSTNGSEIMYTENGGTTWQEIGGVAPFHFLNESIGFYYNEGLYKTINGGNNFELLGDGEEDLFSNIFVVDENIVWGTLMGLLNGDGSTRGILKITTPENDYTEDVWYDNNPEIDMLSIHFADENTGYIVGYKQGKGAIWKNGTGINTMGTNELERKKEIKFYPNPVTDELNIIFEKPQRAYITLADITGKQVYSKSFHENQVKINTSEFPKGTYILSVKIEDQYITKKIILN